MITPSSAAAAAAAAAAMRRAPRAGTTEPSAVAMKHVDAPPAGRESRSSRRRESTFDATQPGGGDPMSGPAEPSLDDEDDADQRFKTTLYASDDTHRSRFKRKRLVDPQDGDGSLSQQQEEETVAATGNVFGSTDVL